MTAKASAEDQDQSMEEILQSIKRIIADEEEMVNDGPQGSDVLELTDIVQDDGTVNSIINAEPATEFPQKAADMVSMPPKENPLTALMSDSPKQAAADAFKSLSTAKPVPAAPAVSVPSPAFRSGATVEDLVMEALRPMLKEWLDANLPGLVERLVTQEIKSITRQ